MQSATALGDWCATRVVVNRCPLLILMSSASYLPAIIPARDVQSLPSGLADLIAIRLRRLEIAANLIAAGGAAVHPVLPGPTNDRSVNGILTQFVFELPYHLDAGAWGETTLSFVEAKLGTNPCHASRRDADVICPRDKTGQRPPPFASSLSDLC